MKPAVTPKCAANRRGSISRRPHGVAHRGTTVDDIAADVARSWTTCGHTRARDSRLLLVGCVYTLLPSYDNEADRGVIYTAKSEKVIFSFTGHCFGRVCLISYAQKWCIRQATGVDIITDMDVTDEDSGDRLVKAVQEKLGEGGTLDYVICVAG